ncbi:unnamed protein product [Tenebrio molitor]|nr:unnamed protein product [Tenebrio molitor]
MKTNKHAGPRLLLAVSPTVDKIRVRKPKMWARCSPPS